jgi:hypothetical protein
MYRDLYTESDQLGSAFAVAVYLYLEKLRSGVLYLTERLVVRPSG